jgi:ATP phosphoribosyltransferase
MASSKTNMKKADAAGVARKLVIGLPKGSLQDSTYAMMKKAGFTISSGSRSYMPSVDDPELAARLIRAQEISRYVEHGMLDVGLTGHDWVVENKSDVVEVANLVYAKQGLRPVRWVIAVPNDSPIRSARDLQGKRIATEAVGICRQYLERHSVQAEVEFSWGATEVKAPELVDAIMDITETGSSLRANNLRIMDTVLESTTRLIANRKAWADPWKRAKIEQISMLLKGALAAETKVMLKLNVQKKHLSRVTKLVPALHAPTVNRLASSGWFSVESVIDEALVRTLIPKLKAAGAEGIIELPLNKVVP